jgi:hypothetical protein
MTTGADRAFYTGMSLAAAVTVFAGFARTYFLRSQFQTTPLPLYLQVHGFVFTAWIALFVWQTTLVAARRTDIHRRLGWAGAALAGAMVVAALTAGILSGRRDVIAGQGDEALRFLAVPFFSMLVFAILVTAAVLTRRQTDTHKRLMLLATISLLEAAIARWPVALVESSAWMFGLTDTFIVIAALYDLASRRRIHPVYVWGGLLVVAEQVSRDMVGRTAAWHALARHLIG